MENDNNPNRVMEIHVKNEVGSIYTLVCWSAPRVCAVRRGTIWAVLSTREPTNQRRHTHAHAHTYIHYDVRNICVCVVVGIDSGVSGVEVG